MTTRIDRLWPDAAENLRDLELVTALEGVRVNFVSSIDGAATRGGLSGGLAGPADKRLFELLRRHSDVVLVGAGTVRAEGYGPMRVSDASARWRSQHRMPQHPVFAIVSGRLDLDPASRIFTEAPVRPVVLTTRRAAASNAKRFEADVVVAGDDQVDAAAAVTALSERGLGRVLCEGGPSLFGAMLNADVVDELYLTVSPSVDGRDAPRIAQGATEPRPMRLDRVLRSGDELLLRYAR